MIVQVRFIGSSAWVTLHTSAARKTRQGNPLTFQLAHEGWPLWLPACPFNFSISRRQINVTSPTAPKVAAVCGAGGAKPAGRVTRCGGGHGACASLPARRFAARRGARGHTAHRAIRRGYRGDPPVHGFARRRRAVRAHGGS